MSEPSGLPFPSTSNTSTFPEKLTAYECGFDPFGDARSCFDIGFYVVSILFIIPDQQPFPFLWQYLPTRLICLTCCGRSPFHSNTHKKGYDFVEGKTLGGAYSQAISCFPVHSSNMPYVNNMLFYSRPLSVKVRMNNCTSVLKHTFGGTLSLTASPCNLRTVSFIFFFFLFSSLCGNLDVLLALLEQDSSIKINTFKKKCKVLCFMVLLCAMCYPFIRYEI
ncbi:uncharacterized protein LOC111308645 [Durio zibethinus]|uniref:NADH-ubiquinone oxidoreductase chain 3 n=1 Tax=Durio zibethinus TaxID=66656 RepID=A0A6P6ADA3_DURZI|nr:uncharacterized protein LOC111308645 [Durio zibethinus]